MSGFCDDFEKKEEHTQVKLGDVFCGECCSGFVIGFSDGFSDEAHEKQRVQVLVSAVFGAESFHGGIVSSL